MARSKKGRSKKKTKPAPKVVKQSKAIPIKPIASIKPEDKKKFPILIVGICGCLLLCACSASVVGIYFWWRNKKAGGPVYSKKPLIDITSPTGSNWYATYEDLIQLTGVASDEEDKVSKIEWKVEGGDTGAATGTDNWQTERISLNEGDNKIIVTVYDKGGNKGEDSIFVVYNREMVFVDEPELEPDNIFKSDPPVSFTVRVKLTVESDKELESVKLYKVDEDGEISSEVGDMVDDGNTENGDDIPNDGTYSYKGEISTDTSNPVYFRVVSKLSKSSVSGLSAVAKLVVVDHIGEQTQSQITELNQQVNDLLSNLQQQQLSEQEIAGQINSMVSQQPGIEASGVSQQGQGVWWVYENTCIPGGVLINPPNTRGGEADASLKMFPSQEFVGKVEASSSTEVGSTKALYLGPYLNEFDQTDDYYGAWEKIKASECPECELTEKKNQEVTVEDFKNLDQYGLIVVSSHGDNWYGGLSGDSMCLEGLEQSQVIIYTSQQVTEENIKKYEADLLAKRLAVGANGSFVILPAFITHYNAAFPKSLVYIATCRSAYNHTLASAFLGRGAGVYYGFDDYVLSSYCLSVGTELFDNFVLQGDDSSTSFSDSTSVVGSSDDIGAEFLWSGTGVLTMGGKDFGNTGFEEGNFIGWGGAGDRRVITSLGPLVPTEGSFMAIISTGLGSISDSESSISQSICFGKSGGTLKFDYNLVSEEPTEFVNTYYDDRLYVNLLIDGQSTQILTKGVNDSQWSAISGIDFAGGDDTTYQTGWQTFSYSLSDISSGSSLKLEFEISDVGDSSFDTAVLIDNIRIE